METKHLRGLQEDLNRQQRETQKMGGPSEALKRLKKRPESPNWRTKACMPSKHYSSGWERVFGKCLKQNTTTKSTERKIIKRK